MGTQLQATSMYFSYKSISLYHSVPLNLNTGNTEFYTVVLIHHSISRYEIFNALSIGNYYKYPILGISLTPYSWKADGDVCQHHNNIC
jgi:hypothetical protein